MMDETYKLCYISGDWAYFTTQSLEEQWGDDWNDAPYEHNAGDPYTDWRNENGPDWVVDKVAFETSLTDPSYNVLNSRYSVEDINKLKAVPWLFGDKWSRRPGMKIWAGTSYPEFVKMIQEEGGTVYERVKP
jgi:hypothetical protein